MQKRFCLISLQESDPVSLPVCISGKNRIHTSQSVSAFSFFFLQQPAFKYYITHTSVPAAVASLHIASTLQQQ